MITAPIWKDTYYETTDSSLIYTVREEGSIVFSGKAYRLPSSSTLSININKICENYLSLDIDTLVESSATTMENADAFRTFTLYDSAGTLLETYQFQYDWSYDSSVSVPSSNMSRPINGRYDSAMWRPKTYISDSVCHTDKIGNSDYKTEVCGDYALYYVNSYGGIDAFLIEGTVKKTDNITQYIYNKVYNNTRAEFETARYISEIETDYSLTTGWLSDSEAENLASNLLGSNKVYLHSLRDDTIIPIVISDTKIEHKTYKNQGKKLVNYTISAKASQQRIRR